MTESILISSGFIIPRKILLHYHVASDIDHKIPGVSYYQSRSRLGLIVPYDYLAGGAMNG